jgi:D-alanine-D-alanine ligase
LSKNIFESNHIPTPPYQVFSGIPAQCDLNYPLIAKPSSEDASLGITKDSVIENFDRLAVRVEELQKKYRQPVLVEEFIEGREFNISILGGDSPDILPVSEISFAALEEGQPHITTYEAKWLPDHPLFEKTPPVCPAEIDRHLEQRLRETALRVFMVLQGRDYGRVDVRVDSAQNIYVLEYNPNPDISAGAGFANAARASGLTYTETIGYIINQTIKERM